LTFPPKSDGLCDFILVYIFSFFNKKMDNIEKYI